MASTHTAALAERFIDGQYEQGLADVPRGLLMQTHATEMAARLGDEPSIIEYGSGNSQKIRPLLDALPRVRNYMPIDIAASSLARAARAMRR